LAQIKDCSVDKLAVLKSNRIEAVMLSKDEYEKLRSALDWLEGSKK